MNCPVCGPSCVVFTNGHPSTIETITVEMKSFIVYPSLHNDEVAKMHKVSFDTPRFTPDLNAKKTTAFHHNRVPKYGRGDVNGR